MNSCLVLAGHTFDEKACPTDMVSSRVDLWCEYYSVMSDDAWLLSKGTNSYGLSQNWRADCCAWPTNVREGSGGMSGACRWFQRVHDTGISTTPTRQRMQLSKRVEPITTNSAVLLSLSYLSVFEFVWQAEVPLVPIGDSALRRIHEEVSQVLHRCKDFPVSFTTNDTDFFSRGDNIPVVALIRV